MKAAATKNYGAFGRWNAYYLEALQGFGYTLSDIEQATVDGVHKV